MSSLVLLLISVPLHISLTDCTILYFPYFIEYVEDLMDTIFDEVIPNPEPYREEIQKIEIPPDLCAAYDRPNKEDVIAHHVSRFVSVFESI